MFFSSLRHLKTDCLFNRMQDEISMGFDRLIAMASEVDKRRKSAENSPVQVDRSWELKNFPQKA